MTFSFARRDGAADGRSSVLYRIIRKSGGNFVEKYNDKITERKIELYKKLGINKPVAKALICLSQDREVTSSIIERETSLKQPEVSNAVKYLVAHNWISVTEVKGKKAGRPVKYYKLIRTRDDIFKCIEEKEMERTREMLRTIDELKSLS